MIYAFTGKKRSGKSTASKYIGGTRRNFKDRMVLEMKKRLPNHMKSIAKVMELLTGEVWTIERLFDEKPEPFRTLMQDYGTGVRRGDDPDYWVKLWKEMVRMTGGDVVVDDVRFLNEAAAVKELGGIIIRINRIDMEQDGDTHQSEVEMDQIVADHTINVMTGDFETLYAELDKIRVKK